MIEAGVDVTAIEIDAHDASDELPLGERLQLLAQALIQSIDWSRNPSAEAARQQQYVRLWSLAIGTAPHAHDITVPLDNRSIVGSCASLKRVECLGDTSLAARFHARCRSLRGRRQAGALHTDAPLRARRPAPGAREPGRLRAPRP